MNAVTDDTGLAATLAAVDSALADGTYRKGGWQRFLKEARGTSRETLAALESEITRVSNRLHAQNGFPAVPFGFAYVGELVLFAVALFLLASDEFLMRLAGVAALGLVAQPLMKVTTGLAVGLRYSYAYLWYFEPRFKMAYGRYLLLSDTRRRLVQLSGCFGTPLALTVGAFALSDVTWISWLAALGAAVTALMQIAAFVAVYMGVTRVGPFLLTTLTTPATLAAELRSSRTA